MLGAIAGHDPHDSTSSHAPVPDYAAALRGDVKDVTIGVLRGYMTEPSVEMDPEVLTAVDAALAELEGLGARVEEVVVPSLAYANIANTVIMLSEAFAYHEQDLRSHPQNFGEAARMRFFAGGLFSSGDYVQAQRARSRVRREVAQVVERVDVLALPSSPRPAATFEEFDPLAVAMRPAFTAPFNLTGMPAVSIPCGFTSAGLPIGLQLGGRPFGETAVLRTAYAYQQHARWHERPPPL